MELPRIDVAADNERRIVGEWTFASGEELWQHGTLADLDETTEVLGCSPIKVDRDWRSAEAWVRGEMVAE